MALCDVVIPLKDNAWLLATCLDELFRHTASDEIGVVIVVDDGPTVIGSHTAKEIATTNNGRNGSRIGIEAACARHLGVRLLCNGGQSGLNGACHFGAQQTTAPYLLFLGANVLITAGTLRKAMACCAADASIDAVSPLTNPSGGTGLSLLPGRSFIEMNELLEQAVLEKHLPPFIDSPPLWNECVLLTRKYWEMSRGEAAADDGSEPIESITNNGLNNFRSVALMNTYVFCHSGGSTGLIGNIATQPGRTTGQTAGKMPTPQPPATIAKCHLESLKKLPLATDVLFVLPGIDQTVGGVHIVIELCNFLILHGITAKCISLSLLTEQALQSFKEPLYFNLLHHPNDLRFIFESPVKPRLIVATLFSTTLPSVIFSRLQQIKQMNFIQGYEFFFEQGSRFDEVSDAYALTDHAIVTSEWLEAGVKRHTPGCKPTLLPIGVDEHRFFPGQMRKSIEKPRLGIVFRGAPDKGQWILMDVLNRLRQFGNDLSITVFLTSPYKTPQAWADDPDTITVQLPVDRATMAGRLRECDIFLDASFHEGFGLLPLEAMASGAVLVVSDSGGINQYARDKTNCLIVHDVNKPERYVAAVTDLLKDRELLARLRAEGLRTARQYSARCCYDRYVTFFREQLDRVQLHPQGQGLDSVQSKMEMLTPSTRHRFQQFLQVQSREKKLEDFEADQYKGGTLYRIYKNFKNILPRRIRTALYYLIVNPQ